MQIKIEKPSSLANCCALAYTDGDRCAGKVVAIIIPTSDCHTTCISLCWGHCHQLQVAIDPRALDALEDT